MLWDVSLTRSSLALQPSASSRTSSLSSECLFSGSQSPSFLLSLLELTALPWAWRDQTGNHTPVGQDPWALWPHQGGRHPPEQAWGPLVEGGRGWGWSIQSHPRPPRNIRLRGKRLADSGRPFYGHYFEVWVLTVLLSFKMCLYHFWNYKINVPGYSEWNKIKKSCFSPLPACSRLVSEGHQPHSLCGCTDIWGRGVSCCQNTLVLRTLAHALLCSLIGTPFSVSGQRRRWMAT